MLKLVVLSCMVAAACASVVSLGYNAPLAYSAPLAYTAPLAYSAPLAWQGANYRGPLSLAPGQPANVIAADGRPLDTLDVNLDRSAHYVAKAYNGVHLLKKRSIVSPVAPITTLGHAPLIAPAHVGYGSIAPIARFAPYSAYPAYTTYW